MSNETAALSRPGERLGGASEPRRDRGVTPSPVRGVGDAWNRNTAPQLITELVETHHARLEHRLRKAEKSIVMVAAKHGLAHGHTWELANAVVGLADGIRALITSESERLSALLQDGGGDREVDDSQRVRLQASAVDCRFHHEAIAAMFEQIQSLQSDEATSLTCPTYRTMLAAIAALEEDYQTHWTELQDCFDALSPG